MHKIKSEQILVAVLRYHLNVFTKILCAVPDLYKKRYKIYTDSLFAISCSVWILPYKYDLYIL